MTRTLDTLLNDALAQSTSDHAHLARPALRRAVARRRVVRKATVTAAASVGAMGLGFGAIAATSALSREPDPRHPGTVSLSPTPTGEASPSAATASPSPSPSASASPETLTEEPIRDEPIVDAEGGEQDSADTPAYASGLEVCRATPLMAAQAQALGVSVASFNAVTNGPPVTLTGCAASQGFFTVTFSRYDVNNPSSRPAGCLDDAGTAQLTNFAGSAGSTFKSRWVEACRDGIAMKTYEAVDGTDYLLTADEYLAAAAASVDLTDEADPYVP